MTRPIVSAHIAAPAAHYAHAVVSSAPGRMLHTSGIVGATPDGTVPSSVADQAEVIWSSLMVLLSEADMVPTDIVSITTYVVAAHSDELATVMATRDRYLAGHLAASTLVTVPALARPEWSLEVAIVAVAS